MSRRAPMCEWLHESLTDRELWKRILIGKKIKSLFLAC